MNIESVIQFSYDNRQSTIKRLIELSEIPSISADGFSKEQVRRSAQHVATLMKSLGLENVEILEQNDAHPYVYADWLHAKNAPTLLLYAHHDVQPPGRPEKWINSAFTPEERNGRLYGRGVVDDKAGILIHLAAIEAYLKTEKALPVNIKFIVEGEEEIGSSHLEKFLNQYHKKLQADIIILTDTCNLDTGIPSITYRLRGTSAVDVEIQTIDHPIHSGVWGGPVADAALVLCKIIAKLTDENGRITIPGFYDTVIEPSVEEKHILQNLPFNEVIFRKQAEMLDQLQLSGEKHYSVYERLWLRPSLSVIALEARNLKDSTPQIIETARARISIRTVPDQNPKDIQDKLINFLKKDPPYNARVTTIPAFCAPWWITNPEGPAFEAAIKALEKGYEHTVALIGCGATIPFVGPFSRALGNVPAILLGLEDPSCNAHSENESLNLDDFWKSIKSAVYLYESLATY